MIFLTPHVRAASEHTLKVLFRDAQIRWKNAFRDALDDGASKTKLVLKSPKLASEQYKMSASGQKIGLALNTVGVVRNVDALTGGNVKSAARHGLGEARRLVQILVSQVVPGGSGDQNEVMMKS